MNKMITPPTQDLTGAAIPAPMVIDAEGDDQSHSALSGQAIVGAVRRWWVVATPVGLFLSVAAVVAICLMSQPVYRASAWLKIKAESPYVVFKDEETALDAKRFVETQVELIRSPMVVAPLLGDPAIAQLEILRGELDPIGMLGELVHVFQRGDSELFRLSMESTDPQAAKDVINALARSYLDFRSKQESETKRRVIALLQQQKEKYFEDIKRLRGNLVTVADQATKNDPYGGLMSGGGGVSPLVEDSVRRLIEIDLARVSLTAERENLKQDTPNHAADYAAAEAAVVELIGRDEQLRAWREQQMLMESRVESYRQTMRRPEQSREYRDLNAGLQDIVSAMAGRVEMLRSQVMSESIGSMKPSGPSEESEAIDLRLAALDLQEDYLRKSLEAEQRKRRDNAGGLLEVEFMRAELTLAEEMQQEVASRITRMQVESQAIDRVELLREGEIEQTPVVGMPWKKMAAAALGCWFLPFAVALIAERSLRRVCDVRSLEAHANAPVLCEIARLPSRPNSSGRRSEYRLEQALRVFEESTNVLATTIRWADGFKGIRVVSVMSAMKNEGKTSLSSQLSICLAEAGGKTLLIDGDLRSPDIHSAFDIDPSPGLGDVLDGHASLQQTVVAAEQPGLWVLPAGKAVSTPHRKLSWLQERVLAAAREDYDYVVIDTPPLLVASEALMLARAADASILCAMRDKSRGEQVREAGQRLQAAGVRLAGVVLNGVPAKQYATRYGQPYGDEGAEPVGAESYAANETSV
ncbi:Tyrosine-protein kinase YwqD [Pseudobythopirellula maris]|uniref:Tyrosine-protein kinase YwqD n=1 Tax=Pseudobythopirellula maris TaxID=2527991 RepID=A0A5C5ZM48_9BACT|nr:polysaccharide biosynthesis tyrosine autokinase [Pseudobythopirellula maris]TWT87513.1 Tyrosine-protein kinase YwqD [Pseudobythopirellula maris]